MIDDTYVIMTSQNVDDTYFFGFWFNKPIMPLKVSYELHFGKNERDMFSTGKVCLFYFFFRKVMVGHHRRTNIRLTCLKFEVQVLFSVVVTVHVLYTCDQQFTPFFKFLSVIKCIHILIAIESLQHNRYTRTSIFTMVWPSFPAGSFARLFMYTMEAQSGLDTSLACFTVQAQHENCFIPAEVPITVTVSSLTQQHIYLVSKNSGSVLITFILFPVKN